MRKIVFFILICLYHSADIFAQCSMCKANAESSLNEGSGAAAGLNGGISYLLLIPYMAAAAVGIAYLYHYYRKKNQNHV